MAPALALLTTLSLSGADQGGAAPLTIGLLQATLERGTTVKIQVGGLGRGETEFWIHLVRAQDRSRAVAKPGGLPT